MNDPELYMSAVSSAIVDITDVLKRISGRLEWSQGEKILDVGSGPGNITKFVLLPFLPDNATVTGLDVSREMVDYANRNNASPRISYIVQDISDCLTTKPYWKPASFDKIFSFYCLHLVPSLDLVAKNLYYLLKPGGYLATHFCVTCPFISVREILSKQAKWKPYLQNDEDLSICSLQNAGDPCAYFSNFLKDAGFQDISCQTESFTYKFSNMEEVLRLCKSITPFLKSIPTNQLEEYLKDVSKVMELNSVVKMEETGEVSVTSLNMITTAKKK